MKKLLFSTGLVALSALIFSACTNQVSVTPQSTESPLGEEQLEDAMDTDDELLTAALFETNNSGVTGTVNFDETAVDNVIANLELTGQDPNTRYVAAVYEGVCGAILNLDDAEYWLEEPENGISNTTLDLTMEQLLTTDRELAVAVSTVPVEEVGEPTDEVVDETEDNLDNVVACGGIK